MNSLVLCTMETDIMLLLWYHAFIIECEDKDLIFRSEPYFIDSRKMFLIYLTLNFNPNIEIFYTCWDQIAISSPFFLVFLNLSTNWPAILLVYILRNTTSHVPKFVLEMYFAKLPKVIWPAILLSYSPRNTTSSMPKFVLKCILQNSQR